MVSYPYADLFQSNGAAFGLDPALLAAVAKRESGFNPGAIGDNGTSFGLMQLNIYGAGAGYSPAQLLDPATNVYLGARYLRSCADAFPGDWYRAIAAYRQGIYGVQRDGPINEGGYITDILAYWDEYHGGGGGGSTTVDDRAVALFVLAASAMILLD